MGILAEPADKELERCDSCNRFADTLQDLDGDRVCDKCDAVFWTAEMLTKTGVTDEAEIVASLAFAAHDRYENLRDEEKQSAFSSDFAGRYPSFELEDGSRHYYDPVSGERFLHSMACLGAQGEGKTTFPESPPKRCGHSLRRRTGRRHSPSSTQAAPSTYSHTTKRPSWSVGSWCRVLWWLVGS